MNLPSPVTELGDIEEPEVRDDHFRLQKDVLRLQVFVYDVLGMQVSHTLIGR